jgi:hypothetical protein
VRAAFGRLGQTLGQLPQWSGSVAVVTHCPEQSVWPPVQLGTQLPPEQTSFVPHGLLQRPQCAVLVLMLVSQPVFLALPSQLSKPGAQTMLHCPPAQLGTPWSALQAAPQPPQFSASTPIWASQPSPAPTLQLAYPLLQLMLQTPELQLAVPFWLPHTLGHAPQCCGDRLRFTSQPLLASPSQLPKPGEQLMPQTPAVQVGMPFVVLQALPQVPQFDTSAEVALSQPSSIAPG